MKTSIYLVGLVCLILCSLTAQGQDLRGYYPADYRPEPETFPAPAGCRIDTIEEYRWYLILPSYGYLTIYPQSHYLLDVGFRGDAAPISFGTYQLNDDSIILYDSLFNYTITIQQKREPITFTSGFKWMIGNTLQKRYTASNRQGWEELTTIRDRFPKMDMGKRRKQAAQETSLNKLKSYYDCYAAIHNYITLTLEPDHSYQLAFKYQNDSTIYSTGRWKRTGNLLTITDSFLKQSFYAIILPDDRLQSLLLPGLFQGELLISSDLRRQFDRSLSK